MKPDYLWIDVLIFLKFDVQLENKNNLFQQNLNVVLNSVFFFENKQNTEFSIIFKNFILVIEVLAVYTYSYE